MSTHDPRILIVDDEEKVLKSLQLQLRRDFDVVTAEGGERALELLEHEAPFDVILTDMRMPGMSGAQLLKAARERHPDMVRVLLTGQTDVDSAAAAVNEGHVYLFLTKPTESKELRQALRDASRHHQQLVTERDLFEKTLRSTIEVLSNVLGLVNPEAFSCASRLHVIVQGLASQLGLGETWRVEVAALLSQLGCVVLPPETSARAYANLPLSAQEQEEFGQHPQIAHDLLASIPRLEEVAEMLVYTRDDHDVPTAPFAECDLVVRGGELLRTAVAFDGLSRQVGPHEAIARMRDSTHAEVMTALLALELPWMDPVAESVPLTELAPGMLLVADVMTATGLLLAGAGTKVSTPLLRLLANAAETPSIGLVEPIQVVAGADAPTQGAVGAS